MEIGILVIFILIGIMELLLNIKKINEICEKFIEFIIFWCD